MTQLQNYGETKSDPNKDADLKFKFLQLLIHLKMIVVEKIMLLDNVKNVDNIL